MASNRDGKEIVAWQLEQYDPCPSWQKSDDFTEVVGPTMTVRWHKNGKNFTRYFRDLLQDKQMMDSSVVGEILLLAANADADMEDVSVAALSRESFENTTSKLHGWELALEDVKAESDWRPPKGQSSRSFKSKIRWGLLGMHDPLKYRASSAVIEGADKEKARHVQQRQQMQAHINSASSQGSVSSRLIVHRDDAKD